MSLLDPNALGIAFFDRNDNAVQEGGWPGGFASAEDHAIHALSHELFAGAVIAKIYRGRTCKEGEILKVVELPRRSKVI
jgi:hypothetical protein